MRIILDNGAVYKCEWCKRNFSTEGGNHLSLSLGPRSGIAIEPPNALPGWRFGTLYREQRLHFCLPNGRSLSCFDQFVLATNGEPRFPDYVQ